MSAACGNDAAYPVIRSYQARFELRQNILPIASIPDAIMINAGGKGTTTESIENCKSVPPGAPSLCSQP